VTLRYLLDTTIVCSPVVKIPNSQIVKRLDEHGHESAIAAPVWDELIYGCARRPRGKRRSALESYLHDVVQVSFPILPYGEVAVAWHGQERARLEVVGKSAPYFDGQIAAIAHANGPALVTVNIRDFTPFRDLTVENGSRRRARS
jgi:tRNA(fMet)-specific endonuclease VapC